MDVVPAPCQSIGAVPPTLPSHDLQRDLEGQGILERCGIASVESFVTRAQLRWAGHVVRIGPERIPKALMFGELHAEKRKQGGQLKWYKDVLKALLKSYGIDPSRTSQITALIAKELWNRPFENIANNRTLGAPLATMASRSSRQHELLGSASSVSVAMLEILENLSTRRFRRDGDLRDRVRTGETTALFPPKIEIKQTRARRCQKNCLHYVVHESSDTSLPKMASFKAIRELLLVAFDNKVIDDDEFLLFYEEYHSKNPDFPYNSYDRFDLDSMENSECLAEFRIAKDHIPLLTQILQMPATVRCEQRTVCDGTEALCMLLYRLAYPCRYSSMIPRFGRPVPELCMITNTVLDFIFDTFSHKLTEWNLDILDPTSLERYAEVVFAKGAPLHNCFGFIDGTVRPISRPGENQRLVYNGHKRVHSLKFQSLALPNGLIGNMYGPIGKNCVVFENSRHNPVLHWSH